MKHLILLIICVLIAANSVFAQRKNITNASLEKYRQERLKNEADYRANYKKLGLPSPEELAEREVEEQKKLDEYTANAKIRRQQTEANFQVRADAIRTEIAATDAEINYLRYQISRLPVHRSYVSLAYPIFNYVQPNYGNGISIYGNSGSYRQTTTVRTTPNVQVYQNYLNGNYANVNVGIGYRNWHGNLNISYGNPYYYGGYAFPYQIQSQSYERREMVLRLRLLEQQRAGLFARWNLLDEEARRADVRID
jgi:hypothetical protein